MPSIILLVFGITAIAKMVWLYQTSILNGRPTTFQTLQVTSRGRSKLKYIPGKISTMKSIYSSDLYYLPSTTLVFVYQDGGIVDDAENSGNQIFYEIEGYTENRSTVWITSKYEKICIYKNEIEWIQQIILPTSILGTSCLDLVPKLSGNSSKFE